MILPHVMRHTAITRLAATGVDIKTPSNRTGPSVVLILIIFADHASKCTSPRSAAYKGGRMDFIEQIFGFSPDGGSGSFEVSLIFVAIGIAVLWRWKRSANRRSRRE